ncbi:MAG: T9SS type A sorting domain-containing protein [Flavobacteriales bacterium]|jgi:YD repeat-containing protein|nr:T9SS type A sorting domain-containing protein [Flavobacteriales bacterium]
MKKFLCSASLLIAASASAQFTHTLDSVRTNITVDINGSQTNVINVNHFTYQGNQVEDMQLLVTQGQAQVREIEGVFVYANNETTVYYMENIPNSTVKDTTASFRNVYDQNNRLTEHHLQVGQAGADLINTQKFVYDYNAQGLVSKITTYTTYFNPPQALQTTNFHYGSGGRIDSIIEENSILQNAEKKIEYDYDNAGALTTQRFYNIGSLSTWDLSEEISYTYQGNEINRLFKIFTNGVQTQSKKEKYQTNNFLMSNVLSAINLFDPYNYRLFLPEKAISTLETKVDKNNNGNWTDEGQAFYYYNQNFSVDKNAIKIADIYFQTNSKTLQIENLENSSNLSIHNIAGQTLAIYGSINNHKEIDLSMMPAGVYMVHLQNKNGQQILKIKI